MEVSVDAGEALSLSARLLLQRPERLADVWRCARLTEEGAEVRESVLEGVMVSFLREIGAQLAGCPGSAWERTSGVLKLSAREGARPVYRELATLRLVLDQALEVLKASVHERLIAASAVDDALASVVHASRHLRHPERPAGDLHFGGVVVERFEPFHAVQEADEDGGEEEDEDVDVDVDVEDLPWEEVTAPAG